MIASADECRGIAQSESALASDESEESRPLRRRSESTAAHRTGSVQLGQGVIRAAGFARCPGPGRELGRRRWPPGRAVEFPRADFGTGRLGGRTVSDALTAAVSAAARARSSGVRRPSISAFETERKQCSSRRTTESYSSASSHSYRSYFMAVRSSSANGCGGRPLSGSRTPPRRPRGTICIEWPSFPGTGPACRTAHTNAISRLFSASASDEKRQAHFAPL